MCFAIHLCWNNKSEYSLNQGVGKNNGIVLFPLIPHIVWIRWFFFKTWAGVSVTFLPKEAILCWRKTKWALVCFFFMETVWSTHKKTIEHRGYLFWTVGLATHTISSLVVSLVFNRTIKYRDHLKKHVYKIMITSNWYIQNINKMKSKSEYS